MHARLSPVPDALTSKWATHAHGVQQRLATTRPAAVEDAFELPPPGQLALQMEPDEAAQLNPLLQRAEAEFNRELARMLARPQDRLVLCERQPDEHELLDIAFGRAERVQVQAVDGYGAPRALLPPPERRALVLIDPPFEAQDEFARVVAAVADGLRRLPGAVMAVWYPLTERARVDAFFAELLALKLPPTLAPAGATGGWLVRLILWLLAPCVGHRRCGLGARLVISCVQRLTFINSAGGRAARVGRPRE